jgi:hypothetical protein
MEDKLIAKIILAYNLIKQGNMGRPQLKRREQQIFQEDGRDQIWRSP